MEDTLIRTMVVIFGSTALLSILAVFSRQSLIVVYILAGLALGPWGIGLVTSPELLQELAQIGIVFLLFLMGMELHPEKLLPILRQTFMTVVTSSVIFLAVSMYATYLFGFTVLEALIVGMAMIFSSTIIALKMLPDSPNLKETIVGCVLLQDIIAVLLLLGLASFAQHTVDLGSYLALVFALPVGLPILFLLEKKVMNPLLARFNHEEFHFNLVVAWCLGFGYLFHYFGLSYEIGAFLAGVVLSTSPRASRINHTLTPLKDFFLILFFFSFGAMLDWSLVFDVIGYAITLALMIILLKPVIFRWLVGEKHHPLRAWEIGVRLTSLSEFSILIGFSAFELDLIGKEAMHLISATTLIMFLVSSSWVNFKYQNA